MHTPRVAPLHARAIRDGLLLAGLAGCVLVWQAVTIGVPNGGDSWSYWSADAADPYRSARAGELLSYLYSPAFLQALTPLRLLDWPTFRAVWVVLLLLAIVAQAGPWTLVVLAFPPVLIELEVGNVHLLLSLAIVLGFRWPVAWAFVLLTKVTPGIGLLWFAARREWRSFGIALGVAAAIGTISLILAPDLWWQWLGVLSDRPTVFHGAVPIPLVIRLPLAALLVVWGARHERPYTVLLASMLALPDLWINGFAMLAALPALLGLPGAPTYWRRGSPADTSRRTELGSLAA